MNTLIHKMKEVHDLEADHIMAVDDVATTTLEDSTTDARKTLPMTREREAFLKPLLVLGKGMVFNKAIFFSILKRLGGFYRFYNIDDEGFTTSCQTTKRTDSLREFLLEGATAVCFFAFLFSLGGWLEVHPIAITINLFSLVFEVLFIWLFFRKGGPLLHKLHATPETEMLHFLFPGGNDSSVPSDRYDQVRIKINLPECPKHVMEEIEEIRKHAEFISARTFILAHESAIGVDTESAVLIPAGKGDPVLCLNAGDDIIVFASTAWGDNEMEQKLLADLDAMKPPTLYQSN